MLRAARPEARRAIAERLIGPIGLGYSTAAIAASSSSSLKMSMNDAVTMPSRSTTKTHGSVGRRHSSVDGGRRELVVGQDRLELPVDELELVRLDVDEGHAGMRARRSA